MWRRSWNRYPGRPAPASPGSTVAAGFRVWVINSESTWWRRSAARSTGILPVANHGQARPGSVRYRPRVRTSCREQAGDARATRGGAAPPHRFAIYHTDSEARRYGAPRRGRGRPPVSNDNPFSESPFKTWKVRPGFAGALRRQRGCANVLAAIFLLVQPGPPSPRQRADDPGDGPARRSGSRHAGTQGNLVGSLRGSPGAFCPGNATATGRAGSGLSQQTEDPFEYSCSWRPRRKPSDSGGAGRWVNPRSSILRHPGS